MEPDSILLLVVLLAGAGGLVAVAVRIRQLAVQIAGGMLAVLLAVLGGMAIVNDQFGYYRSWSALFADLSGGGATYASAQSSERNASEVTVHGRLQQVVLGGARSDISRAGYVYLPPQYFQARFAGTDFPALELLHGSPGSATNWLVQLNIVRTVDQLIARHEIGPVVLVMPNFNAVRRFEECVNAPGALDETYVVQDVRDDILAHYRVSRVSAEWGIAGYSSGGYCAANLGLRDRAQFGAVGVMDGYFRPGDGEALAALHDDPAAARANDPLLAAHRLSAGTSPLPTFWVSAGTGNRADQSGATAFVAALRGIEQVPMILQERAGHSFYAWQAVLPRLLTWMWLQVAPPQLRVDFPVTGSATPVVLPAQPPIARPVSRKQVVARSATTVVPRAAGHSGTVR